MYVCESVGKGLEVGGGPQKGEVTEWLSFRLMANGEAPGRGLRHRERRELRETETESGRERQRQRDRKTGGHCSRNWVVFLSPLTISPKLHQAPDNREQLPPPDCPQLQGHSELCKTPVQNTQGNPHGEAEVSGNSRSHVSLQHQQSRTPGDSGGLPRNGEWQEQEPCQKVRLRSKSSHLSSQYVGG